VPTTTTAARPARDGTRHGRREGLVGFAGYPLLVQDPRLVGVVAMFSRRVCAASAFDALSSFIGGRHRWRLGIERRRAAALEHLARSSLGDER